MEVTLGPQTAAAPLSPAAATRTAAVTKARALLLAAAGVVLGLAGCATPAPTAVKLSGPGFGQSATGVVQFWDRSTTAPFGKLVVDRFNATHKNLKVVLTPVQDTQYVTKLATAIRAGNPPDLVGIDDINSQLFIYHKVFTDLTPLVNALPEKASSARER